MRDVCGRIHLFFVSQEIAFCEIKSLRQGAHCPVDNGFAPTETECRLRSLRAKQKLCCQSCGMQRAGSTLLFFYWIAIFIKLF